MQFFRTTEYPEGALVIYSHASLDVFTKFSGQKENLASDVRGRKTRHKTDGGSELLYYPYVTFFLV